MTAYFTALLNNQGYKTGVEYDEVDPSLIIPAGVDFDASGADAISLDDAEVQGSILYYNGTTWVALAPGNDGEFLQTQGAAADPQWADAGEATTLQEAYEGGNAISVDAANNPVQMLNDTDATNVLELSRTFAGGGSALTVSMGGDTTGTGMNITGSGSGDLFFLNNTGAGAAMTIQDGGADVLDISAAGAVTVTPTAGQDAVITTAGAGAVDINATDGGVTIDATNSGVSVDAAGESNFSTSAGAVTVDGAGGVNIQGNASEVDVTTSGPVDINAGAVTVDGTTGSLDFTDNANLTVTGSGKDLTLSSSGGSVLMQASEGTDDAVKIEASGSAGGVQVESGTGGINLNDGVGQLDMDGAGAISTVGTSTLDFDFSGAVQINSTAGPIQIGNDADAQNIDIGTGGAQRDITVGNNTGTTGIFLETGSGGLDIDADGNSVWEIAGTLDFDTTGASSWENTSGNLTIQTLTSGDMTVDSVANLRLGETNATAVGIGHEGCDTTVNDNLNVSGDTELDGTLGVDGDVRVGAAGASKFTVDASNGNTTIAGNLVVQGEITGIVTDDMIVKDNYEQLNVGYETVAAVTGGLAVNYLPTATNDTVSGQFVAGVDGVSDPTVGTTGAATFSQGDIIQISGSTDNQNDGFFEVHGHAANVLTIRGIGLNATVEPFSRNQFIAENPGAGTIRKVTVSAIRTGTDGKWEAGSGSTTGITYTDFALSGGVDFQDVYDANGAVALSNASDDMTITTTAAGGGADFAILDADGDFFRTDSVNSKFVLGSGANAMDVASALDISSALGVTATGNPTWDFGTGQADFGGNLDANAGLDVTNANLTVTGADLVVDQGDVMLGDTDALVLGDGTDMSMASNGAKVTATLGAASDFAFKLGDNAGARSVLLEDSDGNVKFSVNSDGDATFGESGDTNTVAFAAEYRMYGPYGPQMLMTADAAGGGTVANETVKTTADWTVDGGVGQTGKDDMVNFIAFATALAGNPVWVWLTGSFPLVKWNSATNPNTKHGQPVVADGAGGVIPYSEYAGPGELQYLGTLVDDNAWSGSGDPVRIHFIPEFGSAVAI